MGRPNKSDERKPEILQNLIQVLSSEGIEGVSFAKIGQRMGVHSSLIVHYFKSKEEMLVALVDFMIEKYVRTYQVFENIAAPRRRLHAFLETLFTLDWEIGDEFNERVFWACFYLSLRNERIKQRWQDMYNTLKKMLMREIENYVAQDFGRVSDPEEVAVAIIAMSEGMYYYLSVMGPCREVQKVRERFMAMAVGMLDQ